MSWARFAAAVAKAKAKDLSREEGPDYGSLAAANHALLRRVGPLFLDTFIFKGIAGTGSPLRALDAMRAFYAGSKPHSATRVSASPAACRKYSAPGA
jgi:hypothetical protein